MQTHGVSDADVTKRQLGWYLRNCAESAFAEDIKHLLAPALGLLTGEVESGDGHDDDEDDLDLLGLDLPQPRRPTGKPIDLTQLRRMLRTFVAAPKSAESLEQNVAFATKEFELDALDQEILLLILRQERTARLETLANGIVRKLRSVSPAVACLVGADCTGRSKSPLESD
jgi:hypothetical protein